MATPHTLKQAIDLGHKELDAVDLRQAKLFFGAAQKIAGCDTLNPGEKCAETTCREGYKLVMYCDGTNGCTRAVKVPC